MVETLIGAPTEILSRTCGSPDKRTSFRAISSDGAGRLSLLDQVRLGSGDAGAAVSPPRMRSLDLDGRDTEAHVQRQVDEHAQRGDAATLTTSDLSRQAACPWVDVTDATRVGKGKKKSRLYLS